MKPGPPNPWRVLGWRFLGCLAVVPLMWLSGWLLPESVISLPKALSTLLIYLVMYLGPLLWLLSLVVFCYARFWREPRPLWGRLPLAGPSCARWAMRVLATLLTLALGLPAFVLIFFIVAIPFAGGHSP
jgi:hypothetical protein